MQYFQHIIYYKYKTWSTCRQCLPAYLLAYLSARISTTSTIVFISYYAKLLRTSGKHLTNIGQLLVQFLQICQTMTALKSVGQYFVEKIVNKYEQFEFGAVKQCVNIVDIDLHQNS